MSLLDPVVEQIVRRIEDRLDGLKDSIADLRVNQSDMRRELSSEISSVGKRLESRLDAHVDAPNPHPKLEQWLLRRHENLDERVKGLESDRDVQAGERSAHAPWGRLMWAVLASLCTVAATAAAAYAFHLGH